MEIRRLAVAYAVLMVVISAVYYTWAAGRPAALAALAVVSATAVVVGVGHYRPRNAWPWLMLAAAVIFDATGRILFDALPGAAGHLKPWNWTVWVVQFALLVLLVAGGLGLVRSTLRGASAAIDGAIIMLGAGLIGAIAVAIPYANAAEGVLGGVRVAYVFRDVVILAVIIHFGTAVRWSASVAALLGGLVSLVVYDVLFRLARTRGLLASGTAIDIGWLLFFALIGLAALLPSMKRIDTPVTGHIEGVPPLRFGLVVVLALTPSAVLLLFLFRQPPSYEPAIIVAATVTLILALARLVDIARQLRRQVQGERVLRDAVTDLAGAQQEAAVAPLVDRAVGRLLDGRVTYRVALAALSTEPQVDGGSGGVSGFQETRTLPPGVARELGNRGLTLVLPLAPAGTPAGSIEPLTAAAEESDDRTEWAELALLVRSDKASLQLLRPRLRVLATQAWFTLERIRLNEENVRHISESYFRTLVQNSTDVILILDDDDRVRYASPSADSVFGGALLEGGALLTHVAQSDRGAAQELLVHARQAPAPSAVLDPATESEVVGHGDWLVYSDVGAPARVEVSCRDLRGDPSIAGLVVTLRNVTKQRRLEHELEQRAFHDPLTGLGNRLPFSDRLDKVVADATTKTTLTAVLFVDLDDLKMVNDALGHETGDAILIAVGDRLRRFVGGVGAGTNVAARLGGDEFAALLVDVADPATADAAAGRLLEILAAPVHVDGHEVTCGASVGVATTDEDATTGQDLLRNADLALYAAKRVGKGRWRHYEPWMRNTVMARLEVRTSLERAIADKALTLEYQPIVNLDDGRPVGFEALLRWQHPTRGRLSPDQFIDVAEESGLIAPIGEWVLGTAMAAAREWTSDGSGEPPYVGINVSARQFRTPGFPATVQRLLATSGLRPDRVTLEITESLLLRDDDTVWQDLQRLRRSGVRIAIDDFGTGYSALSYLRHVPLDVVKLDRSFIQSMAVSAQQRELVRGIVRLADVLGLQVIAEGIETERERAVAARIGCAYGQGFLFSAALPAEEARRWLTDASTPIQDGVRAGA